jgi:hypothetical protein
MWRLWRLSVWAWVMDMHKRLPGHQDLLDAKNREAEQAARIALAWRDMLSNPSGRVVLAEIMKASRMDEPIAAANDLEMACREGSRQLGLWVRAAGFKHAPDLMGKLLVELLRGQL